MFFAIPFKEETIVLPFESSNELQNWGPELIFADFHAETLQLSLVRRLKPANFTKKPHEKHVNQTRFTIKSPFSFVFSISSM